MKRQDVRNRAILVDWAAGYTYQVLGELYGITRARVGQIVTRECKRLGCEHKRDAVNLALANKPGPTETWGAEAFLGRYATGT